MSNWKFSNSTNWVKNYGNCKITNNQSPIDIDKTKIEECFLLCYLQTNYNTSSLNCRHTDNLIIFAIDNNNTIIYNERAYKLTKIIFHLPSLHTIDGNPYQMELNFYHVPVNRLPTQGNDIVIISVFVSTESNNPDSMSEFNKIARNIPVAKNTSVVNSGSLNLNNLIPQEKQFYTYKGSIPYPPCDNDVTWIIYETPSSINLTDYNAIKSLLYNNIRRPLAPLGNRIVYYSNNIKKKVVKNNKIEKKKKMKCRKVTKKTKMVSLINDKKCGTNNKDVNKSINFIENNSTRILNILKILIYIMIFIFSIILSKKILKSMFSEAQKGDNSGIGYFYPIGANKQRPDIAGPLSGIYKLVDILLALILVVPKNVP